MYPQRKRIWIDGQAEQLSWVRTKRYSRWLMYVVRIRYKHPTIPFKYILGTQWRLLLELYCVVQILKTKWFAGCRVRFENCIRVCLLCILNPSNKINSNWIVFILDTKLLRKFANIYWFRGFYLIGIFFLIRTLLHGKNIVENLTIHRLVKFSALFFFDKKKVAINKYSLLWCCT